jgi:PIN domain nuclease of toxin-antitoxin system
MRILLDTHLILALLMPGTERYERLKHIMLRERAEPFASIASLWEIAIKTRLGKLDLGLPLEAIPELVASFDVIMLPIEARHAIASVQPVPPTRDPFDRLLLGVCSVEGLRLATIDRSLVHHPLAFHAR